MRRFTSSTSTLAVTKVCSSLTPSNSDRMFRLMRILKEWSPVAVQPKILELVAQMVGSTVVGPDICRDPGWVPAVIGYAQNVFMAAVTFKLAPDIARPLIVLFTPYIYRIHSCRRVIRRLVGPAVEQKNAWARDQPQSWKAHIKSDHEITTLEWLIETSKPEEATVPMIAHRLTGVSFGATHTTSNTITNALLDLANDFDRWAPPLRAEMDDVLGQTPLTEITNAHLSKMWKLDSFLKESQRFHPPSKCMLKKRPSPTSFHASKCILTNIPSVRQPNDDGKPRAFLWRCSSKGRTCFLCRRSHVYVRRFYQRCGRL